MYDIIPTAATKKLCKKLQQKPHRQLKWKCKTFGSHSKKTRKENQVNEKQRGKQKTKIKMADSNTNI